MAGPIRIAITANGRQARADLQKTGAVAGVMGRQISSAGKLIAGAFAVRSITRGAAAFVRTGAQYTGELAKIQALSSSQADVTGKVAKTLEAARGQYAKYGLTVADAASGVTELIKAGQSVPAALKEVNATLVLARAGSLEVSDSAELVSNALNAFHLGGKQAMTVANQLANAANLSSADVGDLGESLKYVSVVAHHANLSFGQTSAMLAILSNNGLKGSLAGTGLRKVLQSLEAPTGGAADLLDRLGVSAFKADGKSKPLRQTLRELDAALAPLSDGERKADLRKLFGLTGIESANILLDNTGKSLTKMNAGINREGAATKLAEANSAGLMGTLKQLRAEFIDNADIIYRKWSPVVNDAIKPLVPVVHNLGKGFAEVGGVIDSIPGPLKSIGIEAGIASLVFPRLATGVAAGTKAIQDQIIYLRVLKLEMSETSGRAALLSATTTRLASAAKTAAGVGGMVLLAQGAGKANTEMGALETTAGAAATGFALGGPWGAAIGGAAGLAFSLWKAIKQNNDVLSASEQATKDAAAGYDTIRASLNKATGAYTKNTAVAIANQLTNTASGKNFLAAMQQYGIGAGVVGRAAIGQKGALEKVNLAVNDATSNIRTLSKANQELQTKLAAAKSIPGPVADQQAADIQAQIDANKRLIGQSQAISQFWTDTQRGAMKASGDLKAANARMAAVELTAHGMPKRVAINITTGGGANAQQLLKGLAAGYGKLTAKDYKVILKAEGIPATKKNVESLSDVAKKAAAMVGKSVDGAQRDAVAGGPRVGGALASGTAGGISAGTGPVVGAARSMIAQALAAMKAEADSHSPSKKTKKLGHDIADGLQIGVDERRGKAASAGQRLIQAMLSGIQKGDTSAAFDKVTKLVDKSIKGKHQEKRQDAVLKTLKPQERALTKIAKKVQAIQSGDNGRLLVGAKLAAQMNRIAALSGQQVKNLNDAKSALTAMKQTAVSYAGGVRDAVVATGDITTLGINQMTGGVGLSVLISDMKDKLAKAKQFKADITKLTGAGLNATSLKQLLAVGPDALATADAIAAGGSAAIKQINSLTAQLVGTGTTLGDDASKKFYAAGIQAAQGLVDGLEAKKDAVAQVGKKLAKALVAEVKKELKIKSPSRVFKQIATFSLDGLDDGFDTDRVRRIGATSAQTLVKSFGTPALSTYMKDVSSQAPSVQPLQVIIQPTQQQLSALWRGQMIQADLDAARAVGVRQAS